MFLEKASEKTSEQNLARAGVFDEIKKYNRIQAWMTFASVIGFVLSFFLIVPAHIIFFGQAPFDERLAGARGYFQSLLDGVRFGDGVTIFDWAGTYFGWYYQQLLAMIGQDPNGPSLLAASIIIVCMLSVFMPISMIKPMTAHLSRTPKIFGDTRWADDRDIDAMSKRDLVGFDGKLFIVGKLKKKMIRMKETLSVLLLAPPGTGKTVAFIVPSAVSMDTSCLLLNDQKPELFFMTSGHRAGLGDVFQLMWSATDMPEGGWVTEEQASLISPDLIEHDDKGKRIVNPEGAVRTKPIFFPSWNPIGPASIPSPGPKRDLYIERLVSVLSPDPTGGGDKFWTSKARAGLIGLIHYLAAKVEMGGSDEYPKVTYDGIPDKWRGKEPSLPLLVDWFTEAQNLHGDAEGDDPLREVFKAAIKDAKIMEEAYMVKHGLSIMNRAIVELTALMNAPDKTRGSILATLDEALNPFKNEAVRQRTSSSSFSFSELRGTPTPEARVREEAKVLAARARGETYSPRYKKEEYRPITIYISVNAEDAKAFATVTGIFVDSANAYLVANGPNAIDDRSNQLGPHDFCFLLDETPTLPKLDTVINGPAVGRSKRVSYVIVGQDISQIESRYSKAEVETLKSTTAIKVILTQNNEGTAKMVSQMAGSMTYKKANFEVAKDPFLKAVGMSKEVSRGDSFDKREFLDAAFIMSMPVGKHVVLVQNFMSRPIFADTPRFFEEPELAKRVYNLRSGTGPKPTLPMPKAMIDKAVKQHNAKATNEEIERRATEVLESGEAMIVVSPRNIETLRSEIEGVKADIHGETWVVADIKLDPAAVRIATPAQEQIRIGADLQSMVAASGMRRIFLFSNADLDAARGAIEKALGGAIDPRLITVVEDHNDYADSTFKANFRDLAVNELGADRIGNPDFITPKYAGLWMVQYAEDIHMREYDETVSRMLS